MPQKQIASEIKQTAELQQAEIVGRLHACEHLENDAGRIDDPRVLYGWNMLTQEVLIRAAEASLKLIYLLHSTKQSTRGHSLAELWAQLPASVQREVEAKRLDFPRGERGVSFAEYDMGTFQDVRYSYERLVGGQTIQFEARRLYLDCLATVSVAQEWLGEITVWPWAEIVSPVLSGYKILPIKDGRFDVLIDNPIEPMDWAGAIIEPKGEKYTWTLCFGFTDTAGKKHSFKVPSLLYLWPIEESFHESVGKCAEQVYRAYQEPCPALLQAIQEAKSA